MIDVVFHGGERLDNIGNPDPVFTNVQKMDQPEYINIFEFNNALMSKFG